MSPRVIRPFLALALGFVLSAVSAGQDLLYRAGKRPGDLQVWRYHPLECPGPGRRRCRGNIHGQEGGMIETAKGKVVLSGGKGRIEAHLDEPGWLLAEVSIRPAQGKQIKALGGAVVAPEMIQPALPRPADFDAFWQTKLQELAAVPANAKLEPGESGRANIEYAKITLDDVRGSHIRGQLARPKKGDKLPAMLIVQWAGVYGLQKNWVVDRSAEGWLVLNINAHDLPIDAPGKFYQDQSSGPLNNYPAIGNDDRETSYFLRMYLSCFRAPVPHRASRLGRPHLGRHGWQPGWPAVASHRCLAPEDHGRLGMRSRGL